MLLEIDDIDVHYGPIQALRGLSLQLDAGEMVALIGANGAGKTTTLRTVSGMLAPTRGSVRIDGADVGGRKAHEIVRLGVAHIPEGRELFAEMTVLDNLRMGYWSRRGDGAKQYEQDRDRVMDLLPRLRERANQAAGTMSGGEQQMLVFARALMSRPRLLLVDELSLGLAPMIVNQLFDLLTEINAEGTAVLLVEQFVHLALRHTSRAYVLSKGQVALAGDSADLLADPQLVSTYLGGDAGGEAAAS
jgi:branched-chain amino acid transport system ATP-binding protein